jgi:glycosyl transferase family 25
MMDRKYKVYVVNLKKDKNRKKHIINELKKQRIKNYEIIDAVNGNVLPLKELRSKTYKNKYNNNPWNIQMSPGQIGCALSHIKIYKLFIKTKFKVALILEDDAIFINDFKNNLKKLIIDDFKSKKQITLLSELKEFYHRPINKRVGYELVNVTNAFFTHAYFINKNAAKSIISFNYPVKTIADNFVFFKIYCGIKIIGLNPFIVDQDKVNHHTTIFIKKENLKKKFLFRKRLFKFKIRVMKFFVNFKSHNKK